MELGQHNITVNAIIPGLVDTPLTRYEKRLSETIGETGRPPMENPTPEQAWDIRAPDRSAAKSAGCNPTTFRQSLCFSLPTRPTSSPARNMK